jgi:hypothetical protein
LEGESKTAVTVARVKRPSEAEVAVGGIERVETSSVERTE